MQKQIICSRLAGNFYIELLALQHVTILKANIQQSADPNKTGYSF